MNVELRIATKADEQYLGFLVDVINDVYDESEGNIWVDDYQRISKGRLRQIIRAGELLLAIKSEEICGCVHLEKVNDSTYKFKMLVANPKFKGKGLGSLLVNYAEQEAENNGASYMQLELLVPTEFEHADKVFLHNWYSRIGYIQIAEHDVEFVHEGISQYLKTGCVAKVYQKELIS